MAGETENWGRDWGEIETGQRKHVSGILALDDCLVVQSQLRQESTRDLRFDMIGAFLTSKIDSKHQNFP